jgi:hypothetical protein
LRGTVAIAGFFRTKNNLFGRLDLNQETAKARLVWELQLGEVSYVQSKNLHHARFNPGRRRFPGACCGE